MSTLHSRLSRKARTVNGALTVEYAAYTSPPLQIRHKCQLTSTAGPRRRSSQGFASVGEEERVETKASGEERAGGVEVRVNAGAREAREEAKAFGEE